MKTGEAQEAEIFLHHKDGHRVPVTTRILPLHGEGGEIIGALEVFRDASPLVVAQQELEELERLCLLDPLTQVGNRRYLETQLRARIDELERYGWPFGLLFCDVDQFKRFNDEHGHPLGDEVLKMVARTLVNCVRPFDFVGRWGGDEFLAIIAKVQAWQIYAVAERIRAMVQESALTSEGGELIKVSISIGAAIAGPEDDQESLLRRVDQLLYRSKRGGMNRVSLER
jgi:diguanylate cyclase (GGDEF)-like protein